MSYTGEWRGPYESRADFEKFQNQSIERLARFAMIRPLITNVEDHLQHQLWDMGKYVPAAFLGLGRYNPDTTRLIVYGEQSEDISKHDFSTGPFINKDTRLAGEAAYERMVRD